MFLYSISRTNNRKDLKFSQNIILQFNKGDRIKKMFRPFELYSVYL